MAVLMSQGRALALILPSMTLATHVFTFLVFGLRVLPVTIESYSSWCWAYDVAAICASVVGLTGTINRKRTMVSTYALVYATILTIMSLVLLDNVLPPALISAFPATSKWRYDDEFERRFCRELDDGFGWDEHWLDECRSSFMIMRLGLAWIGLVLVVAQWWAVVTIWRWAKALGREERKRAYDQTDVEKAEQLQEKRVSRIS